MNKNAPLKNSSNRSILSDSSCFYFHLPFLKINVFTETAAFDAPMPQLQSAASNFGSNMSSGE